MENLKTFGKTLKEARQRAGYTLRGFAQAVTLSPTYICQIELGKCPAPSAIRIAAFCDLLKIDSEELFSLTKKIPADIKDILIGEKSTIIELIRIADSLDSNHLHKLKNYGIKLKEKEKNNVCAQ